MRSRDHAAINSFIREQRRMLQELPDELLEDIGIGRGEIDLVAQAIIDNPSADPRDRFRHSLYGARKRI
jgi:hypothetical protein